MSANTGQTANIEGVIRNLMQQLEKLAPHPDRPHHKGPLFIQADSQFKPPADYDGMMGSLILDSMLGGAFSIAASGAPANIDIGTMADLASEYMTDRAGSQSGNAQLGQKRVICSAFNGKTQYDAMLTAFKRDLPRRLGLERWIAEYQRKYYVQRHKARLALPALAA